MATQPVAVSTLDLLQALRDRSRTRTELEIVLRAPVPGNILVDARRRGFVYHARNRWHLARPGRVHLDEHDQATTDARLLSFEYMMRTNHGITV